MVNFLRVIVIIIFVSKWSSEMFNQKNRLKKCKPKRISNFQNSLCCLGGDDNSRYSALDSFPMVLEFFFVRICIPNAHITIFEKLIINRIYHIFYLFSPNWSLVYFTLSICLITCSKSLSHHIFCFNFKVSSLTLISLKILF